MHELYASSSSSSSVHMELFRIRFATFVAIYRTNNSKPTVLGLNVVSSGKTRRTCNLLDSCMRQAFWQLLLKYYSMVTTVELADFWCLQMSLVFEFYHSFSWVKHLSRQFDKYFAGLFFSQNLQFYNWGHVVIYKHYLIHIRKRKKKNLLHSFVGNHPMESNFF